MYRLTADNDIVRDSDGAVVPRDPTNGDYQMYQQWLEQGNTPTPPVQLDWRPRALADLVAYRARLFGVLSTMLAVYQAKAQAANGSALVTAIEAMTVIETWPAVAAAYAEDPGSRATFDAAARSRWLELRALLPTQVKADFNKYGGGAV